MAQITRFRVRYGETDRMGVVYHTSYIEWFAVGRTEWLRDAGISYREAFEDRGLFLPVTRLDCTFRLSVTYDDEVAVVTDIGDLKRSRLTFAYRILAPDGREAASGATEHAFLDAGRGRPVDLGKVRPDLWQRLEAAMPAAGTDG